MINKADCMQSEWENPPDNPAIQQSNPFTKDDADANAELQGVGLCLDCIKHEG